MLHLSHITTILGRIRRKVPHIDGSIPGNNPSKPSPDFPSEEEKPHVGRTIPSSKNAFVQLTSEIILCIADHLEKKYRVLLSLTSKRMHAVMNSNMCLDIRDNLEERKRFLAYLANDYPQYLICQAFGLLYTWRFRRAALTNCPRFRHHPSKDIMMSSAIRLWRDPSGCFEIKSSLVQAIIRVQVKGSNFGLPTSYLNGTHRDYYKIPFKFTDLPILI
jgi:hypothetical protein